MRIPFIYHHSIKDQDRDKLTPAVVRALACHEPETVVVDDDWQAIPAPR